MNIRRTISVTAVLAIAMVAMAQEGELTVNGNTSGKDNVSSSEKEAIPVGRRPKAALMFDAYGEIPTTKSVFEAEHYLGSDITGKWSTLIQNYMREYDVIIGFIDSSVEILKPSIHKAANKVNKYHKKALKKEEVNREVITLNIGHILDCANAMCSDDNSKSFKEALKLADEPEEIIASFNQVTLRKL